MENTITIWHNELCSTSRRILSLLQDKSFKLTIRNYLSDPPSASELDEVLRKMNAEPEFIVRKKDEVYLAQFAGKTMSREDWLEAMSEHPSMIERPVVISGGRAWLCRPVEEFEQLIKNTDLQPKGHSESL